MKENHIIKSFYFIIVLSGAIIIIIPFIWLAVSTLKDNHEIIRFPPQFFPDSIINLKNYSEIIQKFHIFRYFANSVFLSVVKTSITLYISVYCGYVLAKFHFTGKWILFSIVLFTMMVPYLIMLIPLYNMINQFNLMDTYTGVMLPTILSPFGVFMMRQYSLSSVPDELLESARMDGASEFRILHIIALPLCQNMLSALGIFLFLWNWEDFIWPYLVLLTQSKFPLAVALNLFSGQNVVNYGPLFAATFVSILPILLVYIFLQSRFVTGIAMTGLK